MEYGPRISGLSPEMYQYSLYLLLNFICSKALMHDVVDMELGDGRLLDEWISRQHGEIHAEPLGNLLHIISGNVPMVGFYSVIKGLLAKNVNIVKLSKKDFLSSYYFIRSFADVDPDHPVTKAVSAVYWDKDDLQNMDFFCNAADGMVVWGGPDTIKAYKTRCPIGCEFLEYGPKRYQRFRSGSLFVSAADSAERRCSEIPLPSRQRLEQLCCVLAGSQAFGRSLYSAELCDRCAQISRKLGGCRAGQKLRDR